MIDLVAELMEKGQENVRKDVGWTISNSKTVSGEMF